MISAFKSSIIISSTSYLWKYNLSPLFIEINRNKRILITWSQNQTDEILARIYIILFITQIHIHNGACMFWNILDIQYIAQGDSQDDLKPEIIFYLLILFDSYFI